MKNKNFRIIGLLVALAVITVLILALPAAAGKLEEAIAKTPVGTGPGMIHPDAPKGFMGIPGAPIISGCCTSCGASGWAGSSPPWARSAASWPGWATSRSLAWPITAGAFKNTSPPLNKLLTDSIRVCNQYLVGLSAFISSVTYYRMGRLVLPLGLCLAGGGILGAYLIPVLTAGKINLSMYIGYFGIVVFAVAFVLFYETTAQGPGQKESGQGRGQGL